MFISHWSGSWEVRGQGAGRRSSWWELSPWLPSCCVLAQPLCAWRGEGMVSGVRSCKDANPSMSVEGPTFITSSKPNYFPKASLQILSHCGHRASTYEFGGWGGVETQVSLQWNLCSLHCMIVSEREVLAGRRVKPMALIFLSAMVPFLRPPRPHLSPWALILNILRGPQHSPNTPFQYWV